jgi:protein-L-isoaspartate(D-aspartate) O-methyltransferase
MQPDLFTPLADALAISKIRLLMTLRKNGIRSHALLSAMEAVAREQFVPRMFALQAYEDIPLPISSGQTINAPSIVAKMLDVLELDSRHMVLEVGTGSGYQAAIMAKLARRIFTIELQRELRAEAVERLEEIRAYNVTSLIGNGCIGWADAAPFDRIIVTGSMRAVRSELLEQLQEGGIMIIPIGLPTQPQKLFKITRHHGEFHRTIITHGMFDPLREDA